MNSPEPVVTAPAVVFVLPRAMRDLIYGAEELKAIEALLGFVPPLLEPASAEFRTADLSKVEIVLSGWGMPPLDSALLARLPKLRIVLYGAGTVKGFMREETWRRGVRVTSAYAANAVPVAEFAVAQIILSLKQFWRLSRMVHARGGFPEQAEREVGVSGAFRSTVALLSLGMIGRLMVERLKSYDVSVIAYDPFLREETAAELGVRKVTLEQAFAEADVVSCHTPWLPETVGMIRGTHFASMRPHATFINTARGAVVNEAEMIAALRERTDLFVVLDVTYPEPPIPGSPLYTMPNVVLSPHIAGSMKRECHRMGRLTVEELRRFLAGEALQWEISEARALVMA